MESHPDGVKRCYTKYIFLDVVQFSNRSAEAQTEIVSCLNEIVRRTLDLLNINFDEDTILIPTGDGVCIGLISLDLPYDMHITAALEILASINQHNEATQNDTRQFQIRIGINQNTDIIITDINGRKNIAGAGINMASRIMDQADGGQILVGQAVFHELHPSEAYMDDFRNFSAIGKHGMRFEVHQYLGEGHVGLNRELPSAFAPKPTPEPAERLNEKAAHYIVHAILHRKNLVRIRANLERFNEDAAVILLRLLAEDSYALSKISEYDDKPHPRTERAGLATFDEQYEYYGSQDTWVTLDALAHITNESLGNRTLDLARYRSCFEADNAIVPHYAFISARGAERLRQEWPALWQHYELDKVPSLSD
jgi:hypothetical protein